MNLSELARKLDVSHTAIAKAKRQLEQQLKRSIGTKNGKSWELDPNEQALIAQKFYKPAYELEPPATIGVVTVSDPGVLAPIASATPIVYQVESVSNLVSNRLGQLDLSLQTSQDNYAAFRAARRQQLIQTSIRDAIEDASAASVAYDTTIAQVVELEAKKHGLNRVDGSG